MPLWRQQLLVHRAAEHKKPHRGGAAIAKAETNPVGKVHPHRETTFLFSLPPKRAAGAQNQRRGCVSSRTAPRQPAQRKRRSRGGNRRPATASSNPRLAERGNGSGAAPAAPPVPFSLVHAATATCEWPCLGALRADPEERRLSEQTCELQQSQPCCYQAGVSKLS